MVVVVQCGVFTRVQMSKSVPMVFCACVPISCVCAIAYGTLVRCLVCVESVVLCVYVWLCMRLYAFVSACVRLCVVVCFVYGCCVRVV